MNTQQCQKTSRVNFKDITHFRLVIAISTNRFKMADARVNDSDQELFSELTEPLVRPLLIHGSPTVCRRKRSKLLFTNQRERFMGMEDAGRQLEETICSSSKKPTSKWLFARGVCF